MQVEVPPACGTTSLAGGYLMMTRLREVNRGVGASGPLTGKEMALAQGPIMIGTPAKPNDPKIGRVLGGGKVKKDYPFTLVIKENRESYRTAKMLETVINERFHQTEDGHQKGVATAKTPSYLELKVPKLYHQNQQRFFRVVQLLQMIDSPDLHSRRMAAWSNDLRDPTTAGVAAMKLEGLGTTAVDSLKEGLEECELAGSLLQCRGTCVSRRHLRRECAGRNGRGRAEVPGVRPCGACGARPAGCSPQVAQADGRSVGRGSLRGVQRLADA